MNNEKSSSMRLNEYATVQFVVKWMIENKAGNELDITDAYLIEKITDACHGDLRKHCLLKIRQLALIQPD